MMYLHVLYVEREHSVLYLLCSTTLRGEIVRERAQKRETPRPDSHTWSLHLHKRLQCARNKEFCYQLDRARSDKWVDSGVTPSHAARSFKDWNAQEPMNFAIDGARFDEWVWYQCQYDGCGININTILPALIRHNMQQPSMSHFFSVVSLTAVTQTIS